jgi:hypothetical protein
MPIRRLPNGFRHTHPQAGRDRPERVVAINRNCWSRSIGIGGRDRPECALGSSFVRRSPISRRMARRARRTTWPSIIASVHHPAMER